MKNETKKVSIIIPIYNAEQYLAQALESCLDQSYKNLELLLVNDGSQDNSLAICQAYAKKDERIKIISQENQGVSLARNKAITQATGDYISFVDADDWIDLETYELAVEVAELTDAPIVLWSLIKENVSEQSEAKVIEFRKNPISKQELYRDITAYKDHLQLSAINTLYRGSDEVIIGSGSYTTCRLFMTSFVKANNLLFNSKLIRSEDSLFSCYAYEYADKIVYLDRCLYHYRMSYSSATSGRKYFPDCTKAFIALLQEFEEFVTKNNKSAKFQRALATRCLTLLYFALQQNYFNIANPKKKKDVKKEVKDLIESEPFRSAIKNAKDLKLSRRYKLMVWFFKNNLIMSFALVQKYSEYKTAKDNQKFQ